MGFLKIVLRKLGCFHGYEDIMEERAKLIFAVSTTVVDMITDVMVLYSWIHGPNPDI